ncbi:hypothetical protein [Ferruginibacter albus]|uniref:hypothetical protein n=1 Tax=Ferruginibacter albus TaxID=2875540 RepID=UPI001CC7244F|nr:hypothetical protein [Ferruginibacter albus]UAY53056.1 hypothetical protein K9M53_05105 [Ferruginibacter albus]
MDNDTKKFLLDTAVKIIQKNIDQKVIKSYTLADISYMYYGLSAILVAQETVDERERLEALRSVSN